MRGSGLARRYVKPLFDAALEKGALERVGADLATLDQALRENPELRVFFNNPSADRRAKKKVAGQVFQGAYPYTLNFINVVLDKNRPGILSVAHRLFQEFLNQHNGVTPGSVTTAVPLDLAGQAQIARRLEQFYAGKLQLDFKVDSAILGGVLVRVGNQVIDGTVRGRFIALRKSMAEG